MDASLPPSESLLGFRPRHGGGAVRVSLRPQLPGPPRPALWAALSLRVPGPLQGGGVRSGPGGGVGRLLPVMVTVGGALGGGVGPWSVTVVLAASGSEALGFGPGGGVQVGSVVADSGRIRVEFSNSCWAPPSPPAPSLARVVWGTWIMDLQYLRPRGSAGGTLRGADSSAK